MARTMKTVPKNTRMRGTKRVAERPTPPAINGSSGDPIVVRDSNSPAPAAAETPARRAGLRPAKNLGTVTVGQSTTKGNRVEKAAPKKTKQPKPKPVKKECSICATTRQVGTSAGRGFKVVEGACEHFQNICNICIGKMVKEKIVKRDLDEAVLVCAFPDCEYVLDYTTIMGLIFKGARENWDTALFNNHLRTGENYVACLNPACAQYFSIEDCQGKLTKSPKSDRGQKIACPYCEESMCITCMRPWHGSSSCNKVKIAEEKRSLQAIKDMGAKPCPKCGANIVKHGGCNHMTCGHCKLDFCFSCLAIYGPKMQHGDDCAEAARNIMHDPRNWLPDNVLPGAGWVEAILDAAQQPPQAPNALAHPNPVRPPFQVGAPQQPGDAGGIFRFLQLMNFHIAGVANPNFNDNANPDQNQP